MSKFAKLTSAVSLLLKRPSLINKILEDEDVNRDTVIKKYGLSSGLKEIDFAAIVKQVHLAIEPFCFLDGGSLPTDIALLRALAQQLHPCTYFEIGTWRGESAANVADVAQTCFTLNLSAEEMRAMGLGEKYIGLHGFYSKKLPNVTHLHGNSASFDFTPYAKKCNLVFIDGDHHYEAVKRDTENCFRLLHDEKSVLVWHDYKNTPEHVRWEVLRGILDGTPEEKRKHLYGVSNTLCAVYYPYPVSAKELQWPQEPGKYFKIELEICGRENTGE